MSDPVQNSEVEDVLSSIRRLVSEDKRPLQAPKIDKPAPKAEPEPESERLVLTPALRVGEDAATGGRQEDGAQDAEPPRRRETFADLVTDDTLLDVYPHSEPVTAEEEAEVSEPKATRSSVDEIAEDYSTDPYNFDEDERDGDTVEVSLTSFDEDRAVVDAEPETDRTTEQQTNSSEEAHEPDLAENQAGSDVRAADTGETEDARANSLSSKIEALETAISNISDTWEPDDPGDSDYAGTEPETMEWEDEEPQQDVGRATFIRSTTSLSAAKGVADRLSDEDDEDAAEAKPVFSHKAERPSAESAGADTIEDRAAPETAEPDVEEAPEPVAATAPAEDEAGMSFDDDAQLIDEDALRDLVSEIVREELQGALGERITRNVRKLVRREIHRALTAQELE